MCSASMSSRVCATIVVLNCATLAFRLSHRSPIKHENSAAARISAKSTTMRRTTAGWRTLTATSRPPGSVARCSCAIEPLANGFGSKASNASASGAPHAASTSRLVWPKPWVGACEWRRESAAHSRSGKMSGRHDAHWPHLMNAVPAVASADVSIGNHTRLRKNGHGHARSAVSSTGRKTTRSTRARASSVSGPGGRSSTSPASSRPPSTERSGGGRPRAARRTTPSAAFAATTYLAASDGLMLRSSDGSTGRSADALKRPTRSSVAIDRSILPRSRSSSSRLLRC